MRKWHATVCCILTWMMPTPTENLTQEMWLIPSKYETTAKTVTPKVSTAKVGAVKVIPNSISGFFGQTKEKAGPVSTSVSVKTTDDAQLLKKNTSVRTLKMPHGAELETAGLPQNLTVFPLPLKNSDHEVQFNVSWVPTLGVVATGYSLTIRSLNNTIDCKSTLCYESYIPGNLTWLLIPESANNIAGTCAMRPGCTYLVSLMSHPWDGKTNFSRTVKLNECVAGVCSCAHSRHLPKPKVSTEIVINNEGERFSKITWTLPTPSEPQRLPSKLGKLSYVVSLGKQMISNKPISTTWFVNIQKLEVEADGLVSEGDTTKWRVLPLSDDGVPIARAMVLARVNLVDERGCFGPAGNATAFDPYEQKPAFSLGVYAILGALFGAWAMGAVFVVSARVVKRVLKSFRPAPVSAPLEPLRRRPAWFPLQLRSLGLEVTETESTMERAHPEEASRLAK